MAVDAEIERKLGTLLLQQIVLAEALLEELKQLQSGSSGIFKEMKLMNAYLASMSDASVDREDIE